MNSLFGMNDFDEFKKKLDATEEGFDEEGRSWMFHSLIGLKNIDPFLKSKLEEYDTNIKSYLDHINNKREIKIELKYFQYLTVLFTEIYLDRLFTDPIEFENQINDYAYDFVEEIDEYDLLFSENDLYNLAYWMATGSGKTILFHINYLQFIKYNQGPYSIDFDNILLIAPTASLSYQHVEEMNKSNIPCTLFQSQNLGYFSSTSSRDIVKVIDIYKFTEEKKGQGVTVDVDSFDSKNLVFVDEGHKGSGGEKWTSIRDRLSEEGFNVEYSATFGQAVAVSANKNKKQLLLKYGKSILFDYSYRYFYNDGFGKDYRIFNLKDSKFNESTKKTLMLSNLLTLFEQKCVFDNQPEDVDEYNLENPLWIFVGSKVKGKNNRSDILEVVKFLDVFLKNEDDWSTETIDAILQGKSGLKDKNDRDLFSPSYPEKRLEYIRDKYADPQKLYSDILKIIFHNDGPASLYLIDLKNAAGEIGLRCGSGDYFGLINIGDDADFLKMVKEETDLHVDKDEVINSLFSSINDSESKIYLLVGAKKFIEGWNSWRVSNMGLLNIGKKEGTLIIQLFGRGVRLKGKDYSLKRTKATEQFSPGNLHLLETINIFGIEANYMDIFKAYLEAEGMKADNPYERSFKIDVNKDYLKENLLVPYVEKKKFKDERLMELDFKPNARAIELDFNSKIEVIESDKDKNSGIAAEPDSTTHIIEDQYIEILDWTRIYFELVDFKMQKGWSNLIFSIDTLKRIIKKGNEIYSLKCPEQYVKPTKFEELWKLEEIVTSILKKYLMKFYNSERSKWTKENLDVIHLQESNGNFEFKEYKVTIAEEATDLIEKVDLLGPEDLMDGSIAGPIRNVYFDKHLYQPLLTKSSVKHSKYSLQPTGLNEGERDFIEDLKNYVELNPAKFQDIKMFVLRNLPKKGIGFFVNSINYYPDFIIWIKKDNIQHLIFVDPKGLTQLGMHDGFKDGKIQLCKTIKEVETKINDKMANRDDEREIKLDSFIVSWTSFTDVKGVFNENNKGVYDNHNILFQEDRDQYIEEMMDKVVFDN